ncbi:MULTISPECIES: AAA family ATPase [unclassified Imperialibacter]|uniref:AAA family ATPase n=1 Tax=unclassified Imperialibacter TaxID=2629706 RepID=UPI00125C230C|nr:MULTISPECIES: AAA family ATPase [unclassified Imperialibacter]CAD5257315.1 conserved hypothetical protein [Imperialibacter sp. 89]CAD5272311.1 conserved hypothetical protein [Imperialibacter sp. 75]VVT32090.1 conserved hypothetical protein [Imperialibacter sp. EC-SDR9]
MTLKKFKQKLIDYGRTCIPDEYREIIRIPGTSESDYMYLQNTTRAEVLEFVNKEFRRNRLSAQIAKNDDIEGLQPLESFSAGKENNGKEVSDLFPDRDENDFLESEKNKVANNVRCAFADKRTSISRLALLYNPKSVRPNYTWVPVLKELSTKISGLESQQESLIDTLKELGIKEGLTDKDETGKIPLTVIDPFTFLSMTFKFGPEKRLQFLQTLAKKYKLSAKEPTDVNGIPTAPAQRVWYFPFKEIRQAPQLPLLWKLFKDAIRKQVDAKDFEEAQKIPAVGFVKLTQGLFYVNPEEYLPINAQTRPYLNERGINTDFHDWQGYLNILQNVREQIDEPFYVISYEAYRSEKQPSTSTNSTSMSNHPLNQILFGPPGTGKTYSTMEEAVKIVEELDESQFKEKYADRDDLRKAYQEYKELGQIEFVTFHQSFSYEDFIEGIKPIMSTDREGMLGYEISPGVFKRIAERADSYKDYEPEESKTIFDLSENQYNQATFYKISLGNSQVPEDEEIYKYCIENNVIALGYGQDQDYTGMNESQVKEKVKELGYDPYNATAVNTFKNYLKTGQYVVVSYGNSKIRAIGKVTGEYKYNPDSGIQYNHFRTVEWIMTDKNIPVEEFYKKSLSMMTIYKLAKYSLKKEFFVKEQGKVVKSENRTKKNHVLIIDEINRGNVSQIFGELITLIEADKRKNRPEVLTTKLPYSKTEFSVPPNLFLIGTMNTADRSVEALDTALRRRFVFKEIAPQPKLLNTKRMLWQMFWDGEETPWNDEPYKTTEVEFFELFGVPEEFHDRKKAIWESWDDKKMEAQLDTFELTNLTGINLELLLTKLNVRIERLLDKDHCIGHSYFLKVYSLKDLRDCFHNSIIPLLQEYFYGDFGKIGLVLGDSFIETTAAEKGLFKFKGYEKDLVDDLIQRPVYGFSSPSKWTIDAFKSIYE